ncbi:MAG: serine hydrolase domain-containing protein [Pseudomonadales bacterium]
MICCVLPGAAWAQEAAANGRIDALFSQWDHADSPGCGVSVVQRGEAVFARGYGSANLDYQIPITPRTVFYLASVSKQFTAAAVALAAEQGHLSLDDDIRRWFPELQDYGSIIRVRDLVHHTSGLRDYLTLMSLAGMSYGDSWTSADILDLVARQRELNFAPRSDYLYSNTGYFLLAELIQRATGVSLRRYTTREIFEPLGMSNTWFHDDAGQVIRDRAVSYANNGRGFRMSYLYNFDKVGSGGLYSTLEDLARWDANFSATRIGGPAFLETMHRRGATERGTQLRYAFGLQHGSYRGQPTVEHGGSLMGFRTTMLRFPEEETTVFVLCNLASTDPERLARQVADVVLAGQLGSRRDGRSQTTADTPTPEHRASEATASAYRQHADYEGSYFSQDLAVAYHVAARDDGLRLHWPRAESAELIPFGDDAFRVRRSTVSLRFVREQGAVTGMIVDAGRARGLHFERQPIQTAAAGSDAG